MFGVCALNASGASSCRRRPPATWTGACAHSSLCEAVREALSKAVCCVVELLFAVFIFISYRIRGAVLTSRRRTKARSPREAHRFRAPTAGVQRRFATATVESVWRGSAMTPSRAIAAAVREPPSVVAMLALAAALRHGLALDVSHRRRVLRVSAHARRRETGRRLASPNGSLQT